jgi:hypothetical protein
MRQEQKVLKITIRIGNDCLVKIPMPDLIPNGIPWICRCKWQEKIEPPWPTYFEPLCGLPFLLSFYDCKWQGKSDPLRRSKNDPLANLVVKNEKKRL